MAAAAGDGRIDLHVELGAVDKRQSAREDGLRRGGIRALERRRIAEEVERRKNRSGWAAGLRRLEAAPADQRSVLENVTRRIEAELRRRLGGPFTSEELVELYDEGTDWCSDVAYAAAPDHPYAWDVRVVADAAFGRYLREAVDYAGGRRF